MTLALASTMPAIGQTILEEDFETGLTQSAKTPLTRTEGWTTIDSYKGTDKTYNWYNYYADPLHKPVLPFQAPTAQPATVLSQVATPLTVRDHVKKSCSHPSST